LKNNGKDFREPDVPPVTQPTVSKHGRKHSTLIPTSGPTSSFLHAPPDT